MDNKNNATAPASIATISNRILDLYAEWKRVRENTFPDEAQSRANHAVYRLLQDQILSIAPQTAQDFAAQLIVETDHGESDFQTSFLERALAMANAPTGKMPEYDPRKVTKAGDELNRGIAIINTVWLALDAAETAEDYSQIRDTLYEAQRKLNAAEKLIGLYSQSAGAE